MAAITRLFSSGDLACLPACGWRRDPDALRRQPAGGAGTPPDQDIGTTVTYTRLAQHDMQKAVSVFDVGEHGKNGAQPVPRGTDKHRGQAWAKPAERLTGVPDGIRTRVSRLKIWGPGPA